MHADTVRYPELERCCAYKAYSALPECIAWKPNDRMQGMNEHVTAAPVKLLLGCCMCK